MSEVKKRLKSPPVRLADTSGDNDNYDDDGFDDAYNESFESFNTDEGKGNKKQVGHVKSSPSKGGTVGFAAINEGNESSDIEAKKTLPSKKPHSPLPVKKTSEEEEEEEDDDAVKSKAATPFDADMDLETFMSRHDLRVGEGDEPDPSLRALDGFDPSPGDSSAHGLKKRLGYADSREKSGGGGGEHSAGLSFGGGQQKEGRPKKQVRMMHEEDGEREGLAAGLGDAGSVTGRASKAPKGKDQMLLKARELVQQGGKAPADALEAEAGGDSYVRLLRDQIKTQESADYQNIMTIEKENAAKVDSLLASLNLMPKDNIPAPKFARAKNSNHVKFSSSGAAPSSMSLASDVASSASVSSKAAMHPRSNKRAAQVYGVGAAAPADDPAEASRRENLTKDQQISSLKKELKMRDERLARLTDHTMLLTSQWEDLKGAVAHLSSQLKKAESEVELKEQRVADAVKQKKIVKKKNLRLVQELEESESLRLDFEKLQEREQALLEAVNELSNQNEDLISKLKASMQRELELSSLRASAAKGVDGFDLQGAGRGGGRKGGKYRVQEQEQEELAPPRHNARRVARLPELR